MKPVDQIKFGLEGNCWNACLASMLEISIEDVPDLSPEVIRGKGYSGDWFDAYNDWLREHHGLCIVLISCNNYFRPPDGVYSIAGGMSARELMHAAIYEGDKLVHDPHPDKTGLISVKDWTLFLTPGPLANRKQG